MGFKSVLKPWRSRSRQDLEFRWDGPRLEQLQTDCWLDAQLIFGAKSLESGAKLVAVTEKSES